jgi:hypothetical protein
MLASRLPRESEGDSFHTVTASLPAANTFVVAEQPGECKLHSWPTCKRGATGNHGYAETPAEFSWYEYLE